MRLLAVVLIAVLGSSPASAEDAIFVSRKGHQYSLSTVEEGLVLTSLYPAAWILGKGINSNIETGIDKIHLGRGCDAAHDLWGNGRWRADADGLVIEFPKRRRTEFPFQLLPPEFGPACTVSGLLHPA
ncbi:hypothetical protein SAMN04488030_3112 [Aliiroseovarius halocynthiae]|uniref:Uncharacterized protein n=1 Tax=Aliiroseovarius halocynthiae TaxID=985055 RepID=A0A545SM72_9RHOB|nr:hypothetical protein [Aliiroseovarius halocynthiae]TQV66090.1 hypothetical protein FIL88_15090 [Aliiroseovarius halocynthiae]SMR83198.1 hypothetical protein SAMN04488030_3112 [Aliiroseovarius halocynthiae]